MDLELCFGVLRDQAILCGKVSLSVVLGHFGLLLVGTSVIRFVSCHESHTGLHQRVFFFFDSLNTWGAVPKSRSTLGLVH